MDSGRGVEGSYWSRLEVPFKRLIVDLANELQPEESEGGRSISDWESALRSAARSAFGEATTSMGTSARSLKAIANAERVFYIRIDRTLNEIMAAAQS